MFWIKDKINHYKAQSHTAPKAVPNLDAYSNQAHHQDLHDGRDALTKSQATACQKLIQELWLSECEGSVTKDDAIYASSRDLSAKLQHTTKIAVRRTWQRPAA